MLNAVPLGVRPRARTLIAGALVLACGAIAGGPARAATPPPSAVTCSGHADRGLDKTLPDRIDIAFGCSGDVKSFTVISSARLGGFEVSSEVFDHATQAIVETDSFFCEGPIPGDGFNCTGLAGAGRDIRAAFETFDPVCSTTEVTPPLKLYVVISDVNGATAGPFRLRGPKPCAKPKPVKPAGGKKHHHRKGTKHRARDQRAR
jgi:hypothetical protein